MQSLKKYVLFALAAMLVASVSIAPAHAQSNGVAADVPFDFTVGSRHLTAGSYRIALEGATQSFISLSQTGGATTFTIFNQHAPEDDGNGQPRLVFARHGSESFLTKIVFDSGETYVLPLSARQREILAHAGSVDQVAVSVGVAGSR